MLRNIFLTFLIIGLAAAQNEKQETFNAMRAEWCGQKNCYDVLGVPSSANYTQIKDSFRKLSKEKHPDKCPDCDPKEMQEINNAYGILSNPVNRNMYDKVMKLKKDMDAPREHPILVLLGLFGLLVGVTYAYQNQRYKQVKMKALKIPRVKRKLQDANPDLFPKTPDRKEKRKNKKKGAEAAEPDLIELVPDDELDAAITFCKVPLRDWKGSAPTMHSAAMDTLQFPMTFANTVLFNVKWLIFYTIMGNDYSKEDKMYMLFEKNDLDERCWNMLPWDKKNEYLKKPGIWSDLKSELKEEHEKARKTK